MTIFLGDENVLGALLFNQRLNRNPFENFGVMGDIYKKASLAPTSQQIPSSNVAHSLQ